MEPSESATRPVRWPEPVCWNGSAPATSLIVGLGNCLLRDDGIGVHAVRALLQDPPRSTQLLEVGTDVFSAVPWLEKAPRVLAIDAMDAGGAPGTIYQCESGDVATQPTRASLHELGLLAVLEFVPPAKRPAITVLGVQPEIISYGLDLSPTLEQVLPMVAVAARSIVSCWDTLPRPKVPWSRGQNPARHGLVSQGVALG